MPLICCLSGIVNYGCSSPKVEVREVTVSSKGCSDAFVSEHNDLFAENLRLKQALKLCQEK